MEPKVPKHKPKFRDKRRPRPPPPPPDDQAAFIPPNPPHPQQKPSGRKPVPEERKQPGKLRRHWDAASASEQCNEIISKLLARELDCLICMHIIGWKGKVWYCSKCRSLTHLTCIKQWKDKSGQVWNCPACSEEHSDEPKYFCFCSKVEEPAYDPRVIPHSCGASCGRQRNAECPHLCVNQCHPGACPPCASMAPPTQCPCGSTVYQTLCKDRHLVQTCSNVCRKPLNCGSHACEQLCHEGDCPPCTHTTTEPCYCGKQPVTLPCGVTERSCGQICNKTLACGNHTCEAICHCEACPTCVSLPEDIHTCPCGRQAVEALLGRPRNSCLEPVPTCDRVCDKPLRCGHRCGAKCHVGVCPACPVLHMRNCRCGSEVMQVPCSLQGEEQLCRRVCKTKLSCGRHQCLKECCEAKGIKEHPVHRCTAMCEKPLNCGVHKCLQHCHIGNCERCKFVYRTPIYCGCGYSYREPPTRCGVDDLDIRCPNKCQKPLPCGHFCQSLCHKDECPPCFKLVEKQCFCGRQYRPVQCKVSVVSCGVMCGRTRSCGHVCKYNCHPGDCADLECKAICGKKINPCDHGCIRRCHSEECPQGPCQTQLQVHCECRAKHRVMKCSEKQVIPCDEECERILRNRKLDEAFQANTPEEYSEELVEYAKKNRGFVDKVETKAKQVVDTKPPVTFLLPMNSDQRRFCHELLTNHYELECQSVDQEPYRSVVIHVSANSHVPQPLLSEYLQLLEQGAVEAPPKKEIVASLLFFQMAYSETTQDVLDFFSRFQGDFELKWVNDFSLYLHFYSLHRCLEAKQYAEGRPGPYAAVKMERHSSEITDDKTYVKRFRNSRKHKHMEVTEFDDDPVERSE